MKQPAEIETSWSYISFQLLFEALDELMCIFLLLYMRHRQLDVAFFFFFYEFSRYQCINDLISV